MHCACRHLPSLVQNSEVFTLTYGALVQQLLRDYEDIEEVIAQVPEERREECRSWARDARSIAATNIEDAHNL